MRNNFITTLGAAALFVAAILVILPVATVEGQTQIKGQIAGIDVNEHTIFISTKGRIIPVVFSKESMISRYGQPVTFDDLSIGETLEITFDNETTMVANAIAREAIVSGYITDLARSFGSTFLTITTTAGKSTTIQVTSDTKLEKEGKRIRPKDLRKGDFAKAYYIIRTLEAVYVQASPGTKLFDDGKTESVKGSIYALRWTVEAKPKLMMDVRLGPKDFMRFHVAPSTIVEINGVVMKREYLAVGDQVSVLIDRFANIPTKVIATRQIQPVQLNGVITNIKLEGSILPSYVLEIMLVNFRKIEVEIVASTKLARNNQPASPRDLRIGDNVNGLYDPLFMHLISLSAWSTR